MRRVLIEPEKLIVRIEGYGGRCLMCGASGWLDGIDGIEHEKGCRVAAALKDRIKGLGAIWHSTKLRARETAEILAEHLAPRAGTLEREGLAPNDPVEPVALEIESGETDIMIVSHIPFLHKLAGRLLTGSEDAETIRLGTAGIACLEADDALNWKHISRSCET